VRYLRALTGTAFTFFALLELPTIFQPGKGGVGLQIFSALFVAVCTVVAVRGFRSATVIADTNGVTYRSLMRTRRWQWADINRFEVHDASVGIMRYNRRVLFMRDVQGDVRKLEQLNASPKRSPNPIDVAAEALNDLVAWFRGGAK
jgi:hypothetical protein